MNFYSYLQEGQTTIGSNEALCGQDIGKCVGPKYPSVVLVFPSQCKCLYFI